MNISNNDYHAQCPRKSISKVLNLFVCFHLLNICNNWVSSTGNCIVVLAQYIPPAAISASLSLPLSLTLAAAR